MRTRSQWMARVVVALAVAVMLVWLPYQLRGSSGLRHLLELRASLRALRAENAAKLARHRELQAELSFYHDDERAAVERIARERYGLVRPGELVFKVEEAR